MENNKNISVGYSYLQKYIKDKYSDKELLPYYRQSFIKGTGGYEIIETPEITSYYYQKNIKNPQNTIEHMEFALKYEGVNLSIFEEVFKKYTQRHIETYIKRNKKGKYQRLIWFLYEYLTEKKLNIEDIETINYVDLLDYKEYYTSKPIKHKRYCVNENLLGNKYFAPIIRKTAILKEFEAKNLSQKAHEILQEFDPYIIHRAANYLYSRETIETYTIEGENPTKDRQKRFQEVLKSLDKKTFDISKKNFIELQNLIVEKRFQDKDYRETQIFIGIRGFGSTSIENAQVYYIAPQPKDVQVLMNGLENVYERIVKSNLPPIVKASLMSFSFVYIHPFRDGNGRISRLLVHKVLADEKFTPESVIIPISATMLRNRRDYDKALENFSEPLMKILKYRFDHDGCINPENNNIDYYRHIDLTKQTEYLYDCIETSINNDFKEEIEFLANYDKAKTEIQGIIDLPDNIIDLFINLTVQNKGKLSEIKRQKFFSILADSEIKELEVIVSDVFSI
jgi:Fic family protein